jgi:Uma2 family endonuclease
MRLAMIEDPHLLEQRRRRGNDRFDEVWEGVLHMVPPPFERHGYVSAELGAALRELALPRGLRVAHDIGFYQTKDDFRVPDLAVYRPDQTTARGLEAAAALLVEIVSPRDESRIKLPWYAARDVREVLLIDRDTLALELYDCASGEPKRVEPAHSAVLDCTFTRLDNDRLEVATSDRTVVVQLQPYGACWSA